MTQAKPPRTKKNHFKHHKPNTVPASGEEKKGGGDLTLANVLPDGWHAMMQHRRELALLLVAAGCLLALQYWVIGGGFGRLVAPLVAGLPLELSRPLMGHLGWALGCIVFYALVPMLFIRLVLREKLRNYGVSPRGYFGHLPIYLLLVSPILIALLVVSKQPEFQHTYPFYIPKNTTELVVWEIAYFLQFVVLEFFFRGFLLHGFRKTLGSMAAITIMVLPYMMIHYPKPPLEAVGAVFAGVVLGALSLRSGNIWGGVTAHGLVAVSMDLLSLYHRGWFSNASIG